MAMKYKYSCITPVGDKLVPIIIGKSQMFLNVSRKKYKIVLQEEQLKN